MKFKKILSVVMAVALLAAVIPFGTFTANAATYSGSCGDNLTWEYDNLTHLLTISGTGEIKDYYFDDIADAVATPWQPFSNAMKTLVIGPGVTSIGRDAFYGCTGLTNVIIGNSVTSIGVCAFMFCAGLTSITIPNSVTSIGLGAFYECTGLTNVTIGNSVTSIGGDAFSGCTGLTSITIPDSVTTIGGDAFSYCTGLTSITIPDSVTYIGHYAFYGCTQLTDIYYTGTEWQKKHIRINEEDDSNNYLLNIAWHYYSTVNVKNATCTEPGYTGDSGWLEDGIIVSHGEEIPALGHNYELLVTPPTCTEQGYTTHTCLRCGDSYKDSYTDALGHTGGIATCKEKAKCVRCSVEYGEFDPDNHDGEAILYGGYEPTCTKDGYTGDTYCLDCGKKSVSGKTIDALGHYYKLSVTQPSCTAKGYMTYTCTRCGDSYKDNYVNALGHKANAAVKKNVKAATYTKAGSYDSVVYCSVCKAELSRTKVTIPMKVGTFKITYNLNGGKNNSANPASFKSNAAVTLKNPTRTGYKFEGWYKDSAFKSKITTISKGTAKNITLYTKWTAINYKITYKLNGGKNNAKNPKSYKVTTSAITLKAPTRKGYTFKGWYSDSKFKKKVTKIAKGSTGNKTLYAKWAKK